MKKNANTPQSRLQMDAAINVASGEQMLKLNPKQKLVWCKWAVLSQNVEDKTRYTTSKYRPQIILLEQLIYRVTSVFAHEMILQEEIYDERSSSANST
jgi:hypothetical protein